MYSTLMHRLSEIVAAHLGLYFPEERFEDLERILNAARDDFDFENFGEFARWLAKNDLTDDDIKTLAKSLTTSETYFFRDNKYLDIMKAYIADKERKGQNELNIWCAASSTGEEPYSVAIMLSSLDVKMNNINIIATDINPTALNKARKAVYGSWSFRNTPGWIKNYFIRHDNKNFELTDSIKKMVNFDYFNLVKDDISNITGLHGLMDIVLCRNVLMYFSGDIQQRVVKKLHSALKEDGLLFVSAVETSNTLYSDFRNFCLSDISYYKKESGYKEAEPAEKTFSEPDIIADYRLSSEADFTPGYSPDFTEIPAAKVTEDDRESITEKQEEPDIDMDKIKVYFQRGNYQEAEKELLVKFEKFREDAPETDDFVNVVSLLVKIYSNRKLFEKAESICNQAIKYNKINPVLYYIKGNLYQEQDKTEEAAAAFKKVLFLEHNFILAHFMLGNLEKRCGKKVKADKYYENALSILKTMPSSAQVPEAEGLTSGELINIINGFKGNN